MMAAEKHARISGVDKYSARKHGVAAGSVISLDSSVRDWIGRAKQAKAPVPER
jgi:hypothetical protein